MAYTNRGQLHPGRDVQWQRAEAPAPPRPRRPRRPPAPRWTPPRSPHLTLLPSHVGIEQLAQMLSELVTVLGELTASCERAGADSPPVHAARALLARHAVV
jgi:hypothetical protein